MKPFKHKLNTGGVTFAELIAVLAIISVIASASIPSMIGFVEKGRQTSRMNVARTIYLAAQDQMTALKITKNLKAEITGGYYKKNAEGKYEEDLGKLGKDTVFGKLGGYLPEEEINDGNEYYIHYISKPRGVTDPDDPVIKLLEPVILDKSILENAILIEYNVKTGNVLSAFYSDTINGKLSYDGKGNDSVFGKRGMDEGGYEYAYERKQGYYGTGSTKTLGDSADVRIYVKDSYKDKLPDDPEHKYKNVLYAEILIQENQLNLGAFNLQINETTVESGIWLSALHQSFQGALLGYIGAGSDTALMYRYDGDINASDDGTEISDDQKYARIIWVLDYVGGDTVDGGAKHSIGVKYGEKKISIDETTNLYAGIRGPASAYSLTMQHPYFFTEHESAYSRNTDGQKFFTIKSARHLYNIRYVTEGNFTQKDDIDLDDGGIGNIGAIINFEPIPKLAHAENGGFASVHSSGTFEGTGYTIKNLAIDKPTAENVGLFGKITGEHLTSFHGSPYAWVSVTGLTLEDPKVNGGKSVGALCGTLDGEVTGIYVRYTGADANRTIRGNNSVGGIVGVNAGVLNNSTFISPAVQTHIFGVNRDTVGGIAGSNNGGSIQRVLFLAIAPQNGVKINPIVGNVSGAAELNDRLYYLSGTAKRPASVLPGGSAYNIAETNGIGEGVATADDLYYNLSGRDGWKKKLKNNAALTDEDALSIYNTVYPYPFASNSETGVAVFPHWPIIEGERQVASFTYYELYDNSTWGYSSANTLVSSTSNRFVINDGYAVAFSFYNGEYRLVIGGEKFTITGSGNENNPTWAVTDKAGANLSWLEPERIDAGGNRMFRLFIPNEVLATVADGNVPIELSLFKGSSDEPLLEASFNPLFAPDEYGVIRSPRHISNVTRALDGSYTQQLNVDFSRYCTELTVGYTADASKRLPETKAVVSGDFTGKYDGNDKSINNVVINAPSLDNIGLFAQNSGLIESVTLQNAVITGKRNVGGIAGAVTGRAIVSGCKLMGVNINGAENIGGVAGSHNGTITRTFVGMNAGGSSEENFIEGMNQVGGIAGVSNGIIEISYVEYARVGTNANSTNVGGIAGYMDGGAVRNVFYNYGNNSPQVTGFYVTVRGATSSTGGLVGYINGGVLSNAYSDAYFGTANNLLIGGRDSAVTNLGSNVLYLKDTNYNTGTSDFGGSAYNVANFQADAALTALGGTGDWQRGSNAGIANPRTYTYPRLSELEEPKRWPMPNTTISNFKYYEIYPNVNPKTGGKYGLWSSDSDDLLDYTQKVLEDGYVLYGTNSPGNSGSYMVRSLGGATLQGDTKTGVMVNPTLIGGVQCLIFNLDELEKYQKLTGGNGIEPVRVTIGQGNASKADYFDGYINPLFGKSIYSMAEIEAIGSTVAQKQAYFRNEHRYIIRTPRHLSNLGFDTHTLAGRFAQEIDVDFSGLNTDAGYYRTSDVNLQTKTNIDISKSVVEGAFTGVYTAMSPYDDEIKAIKNMELPNPAPTGATAQPQPGNIGIFSQIGAGGLVENLTLQSNTVSGTTGSVGGLAGINAGTIRFVSAVDTKTTVTTGVAGGIVGENTGTGVIRDISFVSIASGAPVAANNSNNAGGIAAKNVGSIINTLFIASAPGENPIAGISSGEVSSAYYLSGTVSSGDRPDVNAVAADYNDFVAGIGEPRTSRELYQLNWSGWQKTNGIANVLTSDIYPYPYFTGAVDAWPVTAVPAETIAYYEEYDNGDGTYSYGFFTGAGTAGYINTLDDSKQLIWAGYCVIMPDSYKPGRTIKCNTYNNVRVQSMGGKNVAEITQLVISTDASPTLVTVNDWSSGLYINTLFAKGVYNTGASQRVFAVRTPEQMQNISAMTMNTGGNKTGGMTFVQERHLDFADMDFDIGAVVAGEFKGVFDGGGKEILNVSIDAPDVDDVGLFSQNSGTIAGITLKSFTIITGRDNTGGIVGHNLGEYAAQNRTAGIIKNCIVEGDEDIDNPGKYDGIIIESSTGGNCGGIAGFNEGTIDACRYNGVPVQNQK